MILTRSVSVKHFGGFFPSHPLPYEDKRPPMLLDAALFGNEHGGSGVKACYVK